MATLQQQVALIDALLAASKRIVGADSVKPSDWQPGIVDGELQLKLPLEIGGTLTGAMLQVTACPVMPGLWFRLGILAPGMICRIDHTDEIHTNPLGLPALIPHLVKGPHYHSWKANRGSFKGFGKAAKLHVAQPFDAGAKSFDSNVRWFCGDTAIESLPANHTIILPASDKFI